jgi:septation ring formation regulator EzrA
MWQIAGALGVALALTGGAFKMYADKAEAEKKAMALDLRQAADNQLVLESSISSLNQQLTEAEERQQRILDRVNELQAANAQAQQEVESIRKKFAKHDMNVLSLRKPGLIENIINRGTKGVLSDLETITDPAS